MMFTFSNPHIGAIDLPLESPVELCRFCPSYTRLLVQSLVADADNSYHQHQR